MYYIALITLITETIIEAWKYLSFFLVIQSSLITCPPPFSLPPVYIYSVDIVDFYG